MSKGQQFVDPIYDKKDIDRFRRALKEQLNGERNLLLFEIQLTSAFRISDVLSLTVKDVKDGIIRKKQAKKGELSEIHLPDHVFMMVRAYIQFMDDSEQLFSIDRHQAWRIYDRAAKKVGLKNFGSHSVRKTKAFHYYVDSNFNIAKTMELLGHTDANSCLRYIGYKKQELAREFKEHVL